MKKMRQTWGMLLFLVGVLFAPERTRIALQDAVIAYRASSKELALLLGRSPDVLLSITDSVEVLPPELNETTCLAELLSSSPEVQEAYSSIELLNTTAQSDLLTLYI